jgi:hypothetical protein
MRITGRTDPPQSFGARDSAGRAWILHRVVDNDSGVQRVYVRVTPEARYIDIAQPGDIPPDVVEAVRTWGGSIVDAIIGVDDPCLAWEVDLDGVTRTEIPDVV